MLRFPSRSVLAPARGRRAVEPGAGRMQCVSSYGPAPSTGQGWPGAGSRSGVCCPAPGCTGVG